MPETGSELIEFALASTLFFAIIIAILTGGLGIWRYNMLSALAQDGARWASVRGSTSQGANFSGGTTAALQTYISNRAQGATVTVTLSPNSNPNTLTPGTALQVTVSQPMAGNVGLGTWTGTMSAAAVLRISR